MCGGGQGVEFGELVTRGLCGRETWKIDTRTKRPIMIVSYFRIGVLQSTNRAVALLLSKGNEPWATKNQLALLVLSQRIIQCIRGSRCTEERRY